MKSLFALLGICVAGFAVQVSPHAIPGKLYETSTEVITPSAGPRVDHGIDACITADFIFWTARMDGLAYVHTGAGDRIANASRGKTRYPDWTWRPGFKVGLGLGIPHDQWDVLAEYTYLHSSAWDKIDENTNGIIPIWNVTNLTGLPHEADLIQSAKANWQLRFNTIDVSLGRNYFISRYLTLRPSFGIKGSWINQDYHVKEHLIHNVHNTQLEMKNDQDYWGLGIRFGLNTTWRFTQTWSVYGNLALSGLWGQFEVTRTDTFIDASNAGGPDNPPTDVKITDIFIENDFHTLKGILELGIGMRGEWWFLDDRYHFLVQGGWEEQLWFNHNQLAKINYSQSANGDLILQGLTIKARFDF